MKMTTTCAKTRLILTAVVISVNLNRILTLLIPTKVNSLVVSCRNLSVQIGVIAPYLKTAGRGQVAMTTLSTLIVDVMITIAQAYVTTQVTLAASPLMMINTQAAMNSHIVTLPLINPHLA